MEHCFCFLFVSENNEYWDTRWLSVYNCVWYRDSCSPSQKHLSIFCLWLLNKKHSSDHYNILINQRFPYGRNTARFFVYYTGLTLCSSKKQRRKNFHQDQDQYFFSLYRLCRYGSRYQSDVSELMIELILTVIL